MEKYKNIIVGFGKGGKTLAKTLASRGESVLVIENQNECMAEPASILAVSPQNL